MTKLFYALLLGASSAAAGTISFGLPLGPITSGSTFSVVVSATDVFAGTQPGDELLGFGFNVAVGNPAVLQYLGAIVPAPFNDDTGLFPGTDVAGDVFPGLSTVSEPLHLATLQFKALADGTSLISISSNLADPNQGLIFLGKSIDLTGSTTASVAAVPEPGAVLLVAAGVLLIHVRRRNAAVLTRS